MTGFYDPVKDTKSSRARHIATDALCCMCALVFFVTVFKSPALAAPPLRIATWDVSQAEKSIFAIPKRKQKSSWRHTFGSERVDAKKARLGIFNLDVDVVLLQGVRNVSALRRVFPARVWKLILSRDYMRSLPSLGRLPADLRGFDVSATELVALAPVTAVALRYQRRLRVRAIKHIEPGAGTVRPENQTDQPTAATAVGINYFGSRLWLVSLAFTKSCAGKLANCPAWKTTTDWFNALNPFDRVPTVAGRSTPKTVIATKENTDGQSCGQLVTVAQSCREPGCLGKMKRKTRKKLGCIVLTTLRVPRNLPPQRALPLPDR